MCRGRAPPKRRVRAFHVARRRLDRIDLARLHLAGVDLARLHLARRPIRLEPTGSTFKAVTRFLWWWSPSGGIGRCVARCCGGWVVLIDWGPTE
jgi:hypothetical protein